MAWLVNLLIFADDLVLVAASYLHLQQMVNDVIKTSGAHGMRVAFGAEI